MRSVDLILISIFACIANGCGLCFSQADCPGMHSIDVVTADGAVITNFAGRVSIDGTDEGFDVSCQAGIYEPNTDYSCSTNTLQLRHIESPITVTLDTENGSKRAEASYTLSIDTTNDTCSCDTFSSYTLMLD